MSSRRKNKKIFSVTYSNIERMTKFFNSSLQYREYGSPYCLWKISSLDGIKISYRNKTGFFNISLTLPVGFFLIFNYEKIEPSYYKIDLKFLKQFTSILKSLKLRKNDNSSNNILYTITSDSLDKIDIYFNSSDSTDANIEYRLELFTYSIHESPEEHFYNDYDEIASNYIASFTFNSNCARSLTGGLIHLCHKKKLEREIYPIFLNIDASKSKIFFSLIEQGDLSFSVEVNAQSGNLKSLMALTSIELKIPTKWALILNRIIMEEDITTFVWPEKIISFSYFRDGSDISFEIYLEPK